MLTRVFLHLGGKEEDEEEEKKNRIKIFTDLALHILLIEKSPIPTNGSSGSHKEARLAAGGPLRTARQQAQQLG